MASTGDRTCPECGGDVDSANGTDYECVDCGTGYDHMDLFYP